MKAIAYAIAGSSSMAIAAFGASDFSFLAAAWSGVLFTILIFHKEPTNDR